MNPKFILVLIHVLVFILYNSTKAQDFEWAKRIGGIGHDNVKSIAIDKSGNIYTAGNFEWTADFDPDVVGIANIASVGGHDIFISKLDLNGNYLWTKTIGSPFDEVCYATAVDNLGNVYVTGFFSDTIDFDPGVSVFNLIPDYGLSVFILKLDSLGNFVWAKSVGTHTSSFNYYSHPYMALDQNANVYISNAFWGPIDFDPSAGVFNLGGGGVFILKLDSSGNFVWVKSIGNGECYGLSVDAAGNIYSTGSFTGTQDFDPNAGIFNLTAQNYGGCYVSKLDTSGSFVWAKSFQGAFGTYPSGIIVDINKNTLVTGYFRDSADFNPGIGYKLLSHSSGSDVFVLKLDSLGSFSWAKNMGGIGNDESRGITVDNWGNVYTTGLFNGIADFDPDLGIYNLTFNGAFDIFISKLDANGNFVWARGMGGTDLDLAYGIALDTNNNIYTTGLFSTTVDFDPGAGVYNLTATASTYDMFIHKMSQPLPTPITKTENPLFITLYPNPTNGILQLEIAQNFGIATIETINTLGQVLARTQTSDRNSRLVLPDEAGIYFIRVEVEGNVGVYRVVRE